MKVVTIELTKQVQEIVIIEVELPYYYKHDLMSEYGDSVIYGKIEEKSSVSIQEIEKEEYDSIKNANLSSYFEKRYKSNKEEFDFAKERCLSFLNGI